MSEHISIRHAGTFAGETTAHYRDGYARMIEGGSKAILYPPADRQGKWLYLNGVSAAATMQGFER